MRLTRLASWPSKRDGRILLGTAMLVQGWVSFRMRSGGQRLSSDCSFSSASLRGHVCLITEDTVSQRLTRGTPGHPVESIP